MTKISKEQVAELETAVFPGRIIVIQSESEAEKAVSYLEKFELIGFDTETRPSFTKGVVRKLSLIHI